MKILAVFSVFVLVAVNCTKRQNHDVSIINTADPKMQYTAEDSINQVEDHADSPNSLRVRSFTNCHSNPEGIVQKTGPKKLAESRLQHDLELSGNTYNRPVTIRSNVGSTNILRSSGSPDPELYAEPDDHAISTEFEMSPYYVNKEYSSGQMSDNNVMANSLRSKDNNPDMRPKVKTWTARELFDAIRAKSNQDMLPYIRKAAYLILFSMFTGRDWKEVLAAIPSPSNEQYWTLKQLEEYSEKPQIDEEFRAPLDHAYHLLIELQRTNPEANIQRMPVAIAALDISIWTKKKIEYALNNDRNIKPELKKHLERALDSLMYSIVPGDDTVGLVTAVGLIENNPEFYELHIPEELNNVLEKKTKEPIKNIVKGHTPKELLMWNKSTGI